MLRATLLAGLCLFGAEADPPVVGPPRGSLVIAGGGRLPAAIVARFLSLAGGKDARILLIPTADEREPAPDAAARTFLAAAGATNVAILHTRSRKEADSEAFVEPLRQASGVWFAGGRQWRLVDSYLGTRTERELHALLDRGGVIGGTSAGATIQGSYLVRGAREGNSVMMAPGYETGFGYLRNTAIDQHLLRRKREKDLLQVIERFPALLGIGIDESTAIVASGDEFEVIGESKVAIYDAGYQPPEGQQLFYFLQPGDRFDLSRRSRTAARNP